MTVWQSPQFAGPQPKKKKDLGIGMNIASIALPLAASIFGGPLGGAAASALMGGLETKLGGGSLKEALLSGAISGGTGALTAGIAPGGAGRGVEKVLGKGAVEAAGKNILKGQGTKVGLGLTADMLSGEAGKQAFSLGTDTMFKGAMSQGLKQGLATGAGKVLAEGAETTAKMRFIEHAQGLGTQALGAFGEAQAEGAERRGRNEAINVQMQNRIESAMQGQFIPSKSKYYRPYGG